MRKAKICAFLLTLILSLALLIMPFGAISVSAAESTNTQVTATTSISVKQGNSGYCYVYIDSLESLSTLSVTVHYDADKIKVQDGYVYNTVSSLLNDKSVGESSVQFSYIFDGKGQNTKTQLFYFRYTVLSDAEVGDTYFDIVVNEAYDSSLQPVSVSGSRCAFLIAEMVTTKTCSIYSSSSVSTAVGEEFEISYRLSTYQIASGSFTISYNPELFEVVGVTNGAFCNNKIVDVNTKLAGSVYVSFVGTEYKSNTNLITVKFKTLKNVAEKSIIKMTVTEFYDLALNLISCSGYTTTANISFDKTYTEDAPSMTLQTAYNAATEQVRAVVKLEKNSCLGAGDFVLAFDTTVLSFVSYEKGFTPSFFNVNDKQAAEGKLKFSIISLSDIMTEETVITVVFNVTHSCKDVETEFNLSGSGLVDSLTNSILLNFVDSSVIVPLKHSIVSHKAKAPTCTEIGWNAYETCTRCDYSTYEELAELGHDEVSHEAKVPTCTEIGWNAYETCTRCDYTTYEEIPAKGHSYEKVVTAPTCTEEGYTTYSCHCGDTYKADYVEALGHTEVIDKAKEPTCTTIGWKAYEMCTRCDYTTYEEIPALGHTEGEAVEENRKESTCTVAGSYDEVVYCSVCKTHEISRETKTIALVNHTSSAAVKEKEVAADCENTGSYDLVVYCSVCGGELSRETTIVSALGHDYKATVTIPTCTAQGYTTYTCEVCGDSYVNDYVNAKGHTESAWIVDKEAMIGVKGYQHTECTVCGETLKEEDIPALNKPQDSSSSENPKPEIPDSSSSAKPEKPDSSKPTTPSEPSNPLASLGCFGAIHNKTMIMVMVLLAFTLFMSKKAKYQN